MLASSSSSEAGKRLRAIRERLGLTTRDVERLSEQIAAEKNDQVFSVSHNWVSDVENGKFRPRLAKLYALCLIYKCEITEMLRLFGLNVLDLTKDKGIVSLPQTHLVPSITDQVQSLTIPSNSPLKTVLGQTTLLHRTSVNTQKRPYMNT